MKGLESAVQETEESLEKERGCGGGPAQGFSGPRSNQGSRENRAGGFPAYVTEAGMGVAACPDRPSRHGRGNTEIRCVRCFRRKEPWLFEGSPVLPRKGIFLWRISSACFFVSRFYGAAVERELQVRVLLYRPGACVSSFLRGLPVFSEGPRQTKRAPIFQSAPL